MFPRVSSSSFAAPPRPAPLAAGDTFQAKVTVVQGRETGKQLQLAQPLPFRSGDSRDPRTQSITLLEMGKGWNEENLKPGQSFTVTMKVVGLTTTGASEGIEPRTIVTVEPVKSSTPRPLPSDYDCGR